ncbi:MAG: hypothetical protein ABR568_21905, partial [Pyrinomonadaceae bacterium]
NLRHASRFHSRQIDLIVMSGEMSDEPERRCVWKCPYGRGSFTQRRKGGKDAKKRILLTGSSLRHFMSLRLCPFASLRDIDSEIIGF